MNIRTHTGFSSTVALRRQWWSSRRRRGASLRPTAPRPHEGGSVPSASRLSRIGRATRRGGAGESGQALVEFAIVAPVLLLLVFGILEFGWTYNNYIQLTNAADAGARLFAIERGQATVCSDVQSEVDQTAADLTSGNLVVSMEAEDASSGTEGTWSSNGSGTNSCPWDPPGEMISGTPAQLTVSYPWSVSFLGLKVYSGTLSTSATENVT